MILGRRPLSASGADRNARPLRKPTVNSVAYVPELHSAVSRSQCASERFDISGGRLLITEARSSSPTIPSPVAISVTNVRSDGTSPVGVTVQRVIPEPLLVTRVEQRDEIE